jgi:hypothetical protein
MGRKDGDVAIKMPSEVRFLQACHQRPSYMSQRGVGNTASIFPSPKKYSEMKVGRDCISTDERQTNFE